MQEVKVKVIYEPSPEYLLDPEYNRHRDAIGLGFSLFRYQTEDVTIRYTPHEGLIIAEIEWHGFYPIIFKIGRQKLWTKADKVEAIRKRDLKELLKKHIKEYGDGKVFFLSGLKTLKQVIKYVYSSKWRKIWDYLEDHYYYRLTSIKYLHELITILEYAEDPC